MFDASFRAHGKLLRSIAGNSTLNVGSILEGRVEHRLLIRTMRTPVGAVHFHALLREAARERVVSVSTPVISEIIGNSKRNQNNCADDYLAQEGWISLRLLLYGLLSFSSLLGHEGFYTTTRRAEGRTSSVCRCKVRASPSTMTSTGPSSSKSMRRALRRSASGCCTCVPS